jgi:hypothetical protein
MLPRPENLVKPAQREAVAVLLSQLRVANKELERAAMERRERRIKTAKALETHRGGALMLKGDVVTIRFKGEDAPLPARPTGYKLPPDYYTVVMLGSHKQSSAAESIPVVWLRPPESRDIAAYASPIDTLESASLAEIKAAYTSREIAE